MKFKAFRIVGDSTRKDIAVEVEAQVNAFLSDPKSGAEKVVDLKVEIDFAEGGYGMALVTILYVPKAEEKQETEKTEEVK